MKVDIPVRNDHRVYITVQPFDTHGVIRIEKERDVLRFLDNATWQPARVSWFATGALEVEQAQKFAAAMSLACVIAAALDADPDVLVIPHL